MATKRYKSILTIDWDWFFPRASDHAGYCGACSWKNKCKEDFACYEHRAVLGDGPNFAGGPFHVGAPVHQPAEVLTHFGIPGLIVGADLRVTECHADLYRYIRDTDDVVNLDAHSDSNFHWGGVSCGSWAALALAKQKVQRYQWVPRPTPLDQRAEHYRVGRVAHHRDYGGDWYPLQLPGYFDLVFLCWSRPWTPGSWDRHFAKFIRHLETLVAKPAKVVGPARPKITKLLRQTAP